MAKRIIVLAAFLFFAWTGLAQAGMIALWDGNATVPANWTCISCTSIPPEGSDIADFYDRMPYCNASGYGVKGGLDSHSHTTALAGSSQPSGTAAVQLGTPNGFNSASATHTHSTATAQSFPSNSSTPPYRDLLFIRYDYGVPSVVPGGAIIFFNSTSIPSGFERYVEEDGYFLRGSANANATGGQENHSHNNLSVKISGATGAGVTSGTFKWSVATSSHYHWLNGSNASESSNVPLYYGLVLVKANGSQAVPDGAILMSNASVSEYGWALFDACDGRYLKAESEFGSTGGAANHTHAIVSGTTSAGVGGQNRNTGTTNFAYGGHTHNVNVSFSYANNTPKYTSVLLYQYAETVVDNETLARQAVLEGVNAELEGADAWLGQRVYVRFDNGTQKNGKFDVVAVFGDQTWAFNYLTGSESYSEVSSLRQVVNVWHGTGLTYSQIVAQVREFISQTVN